MTQANVLTKEEISTAASSSSPLTVFHGFDQPTSNTTYCPNQFFDVCLPYSSRGCVRLIGYLIRKSLGWCDADGNPVDEQIKVSYADLVKHAGISNGSIPKAISEAETGGFIERVQSGCPSGRGQAFEHAVFQLKWDLRPDYLKDPHEFDGFFGGEGNRTPIPNQFFDHVVRNEKLSVIKVVGSIIRFTIGFQTKHGFRRRQVRFSYAQIKRYAKLRDRALSEAVQYALSANYLARPQLGVFDPDGGRQSVAAVYSVKWVDQLSFESRAKKESGVSPNEHAKKESGENFGARQKGKRRLAKKEIGQHAKKESDIKTTLRNNTSKQQHPAAAGEDLNQATEVLLEAGFDRNTAQELAGYGQESIRQQIGWLDARRPTSSRLGMLRKAIEQDWSAPKVGHAQLFGDEAHEFAQRFYAGLAGHGEKSIAEPSNEDLRSAVEFLKRIEGLGNDQKAGEWGIEFGRMVAAQSKGFQGVHSLKSALRIHGDRFYVAIQNQTKAARSKSKREESEREGERQQTHQKRYRQPYLDHVAKLEVEIRRDHSDDYQEFLDRRDEERVRLQRLGKGRTSSLAQRFLDSFDSDSSRLEALAKRFREQVPDFWTWDREFNPASYSPDLIESSS